MRFALFDVLSVGGRARDRNAKLLPARPAAPVDGRVESEALVIMAAEFRRLREQEQSLHRRQAESLEIVADALRRLADGRDAPPTPVAHGEALDPLRAEPAAHDDEIRALRETRDRDAAELSALRAELATRDHALRALCDSHDRGEAELRALRGGHDRGEAEREAVLRELAEARACAERDGDRLAATQRKLQRARAELAVAKAPWWRRRRLRGTLG